MATTLWQRRGLDSFDSPMRANSVMRKLFYYSPAFSRHLISLLVLGYIVTSTACFVNAQDSFIAGYDLIRDEGSDENRRGAINFLGAGVSVADDSSNNETEVTITAGSGDIESIGDCASGACFDGTQGTILTFNNASGDQTFQFDNTTQDFLLSDDLTIADTSPFVELCDETDNVAFIWHLDTAEVPSGATFWRGTNSSCTGGFNRAPTYPALLFDTSDILTINNGVLINPNALTTGDFNIASFEEPNMFKVDYSENTVGIGTAAPDFHLDIHHTADDAGDISMHLEHDANSFPSTVAFQIDVTATLISAEEEVTGIVANMNTADSTGGEMDAFTVVVVGSGSAEPHALRVGPGIEVIEHSSGVPGNVGFCEIFDDSGSSFTDCVTAASSESTDVQIFVEEDDILYIGKSTKFSTISFDLAIGAGPPGIKPTFEHSITGDAFTIFGPLDTTKGMRESGTILMDLDVIGGDWVTATVDGDSAFWIRIKRRRNTISPVPTENLIQITETKEFGWDKLADVIINTMSLEADGVKLSGDNDGALTILGLGNGADENWIINLDDTANTVVHGTSTGVTLHDWGTINLATDALDLSEGNITNVGDISLDSLSSDGNDITITPTNNTIFSDGTKVLIGHTSDLLISNNSPFQIVGTSGAKASMAMARFTNTASSVASYNVLKSRSGTPGSFAIVSDNDAVGRFKFLADDGVDYNTQIALFEAEIDDANPAAGVIGGALIFSTGDGVSATPTERMRIASDGVVTLKGDVVLSGSGLDISGTDTVAGADTFGLHWDGEQFYIRNNKSGGPFGLLINAGGVDGVSIGAAGFEPTFVQIFTDGTGDGELIVPDDSIGNAEIGGRVAQLVVFDFTTDTATGDGKFYLHIGPNLAGSNLESFRCAVVSTGTTGTLDVDLAKCADPATGNACSGTVTEMLSVKLTIDSGEDSSDTAAIPVVIRNTEDDVADGDWVRLDVDAVHTTAAKGLNCILAFQKP